MEKFAGEKIFSPGRIDGPFQAYGKSRERGYFWGQELGVNL
jgi:hypothetical protein